MAKKNEWKNEGKLVSCSTCIYKAMDGRRSVCMYNPPPAERGLPTTLVDWYCSKFTNYDYSVEDVKNGLQARLGAE